MGTELELWLGKTDENDRLLAIDHDASNFIELARTKAYAELVSVTPEFFRGQIELDSGTFTHPDELLRAIMMQLGAAEAIAGCCSLFRPYAIGWVPDTVPVQTIASDAYEHMLEHQIVVERGCAPQMCRVAGFQVSLTIMDFEHGLEMLNNTTALMDKFREYGWISRKRENAFLNHIFPGGAIPPYLADRDAYYQWAMKCGFAQEPRYNWNVVGHICHKYPRFEARFADSTKDKERMRSIVGAMIEIADYPKYDTKVLVPDNLRA